MTNFSGDNHMKSNLLLSDNPLYIVDVGAREGMHSRWNKFTSSYKGILFEPDPKEYKLLKSKLCYKLKISLLKTIIYKKNAIEWE